jgi:hypothetical protein
VDKRSHTEIEAMFRPSAECGDRDLDLPGCRYFSLRTDESHLSGWVSQSEYRWLCDRFGITPPEKPEPPNIESVAYDTASKPLNGFSVRASYLKDSPNALIEISKAGKVIRSFEYPAYRIWNIPAHFSEYIDGLDEEGRTVPLSDEKETP